jgi:hypothetical protein
VELSALTCTPHLLAEGAVNVSVSEDEPQAAGTIAAAATTTAARNPDAGA